MKERREREREKEREGESLFCMHCCYIISKFYHIIVDFNWLEDCHSEMSVPRRAQCYKKVRARQHMTLPMASWHGLIKGLDGGLSGGGSGLRSKVRLFVRLGTTVFITSASCFREASRDLDEEGLPVWDFTYMWWNNKAHNANDASSWWWNDCMMVWLHEIV